MLKLLQSCNYLHILKDLPKDEMSKDSGDEGSQDTDSVVSGLAGGLEPPKRVGTIHLANAGKCSDNLLHVHF